MFVLISYDVSTKEKTGARRLRRIARACQNKGQRVQFSVFECIVSPAEWVMLKNELLREMDASKDSLRFYYLGAKWKRKVEHVGIRSIKDMDDVQIV